MEIPADKRSATSTKAADFASGVLLLHPSDEFSHLRMVPQFFQGVEFLGEVAVLEKGVNLFVAGGTDSNRGARVLLATFGVLSGDEVMGS